MTGKEKGSVGAPGQAVTSPRDVDLSRLGHEVLSWVLLSWAGSSLPQLGPGDKIQGI